MKTKVKYVVIYVDFPTMRERHFDNEKEANLFSKKVNGSICEIKI